MSAFSIKAKLVDVHNKKIHPAEITVENGKIKSLRNLADKEEYEDHYLLPGFIDSHVHIESSMLVPSEFAKLAVVHGTVATVSDPHEIANVCGLEGVEYMIANGKTVPFKFHFGAPSCVPATKFETAGANLGPQEVQMLLEKDDIFYLSEMMNFPGVLTEDEEVMSKIAIAHRLLKPVDGHAPGLRGEEAKKYIAAGITTDHECFTREEALDKLQNGMKILVREGSAAKNFEALIELLHDYPNQMMFCSDDKHPDSLVAGHINQLCARAVARGIEIFKVLQAACVNPVEHYKMKLGLLRPGDAADFIVVKDLVEFEVIQTYIDGMLVAEHGRSLVQTSPARLINNFSCKKRTPADFEMKWPGANKYPVIEALDGQLITNKLLHVLRNEDGKAVVDPGNDILKIAVVNRYKDSPVAVAFIRNFGLKAGALASSVAHDSHNIVVVGASDEDLCRAVNLVIGEKGGISFIHQDVEMVVPLPVAGLMSNADGYKIAELYHQADKAVKNAGCGLGAPFMTLSFMALLVIPHLKLSDLGLFDGDAFSFTH